MYVSVRSSRFQDRILPVSSIHMFSVLEEIILHLNDATTQPRGGLNSAKVLNMS